MRSAARLLSFALVTSPLAAQQPSADGPLATVERLFAAMRQRDTAAMRALFDSTARLISTGDRNGQPVLRVIPIDRWIESVGRAAQELDERIWDPVVEVDGNLATVWVKYEFLAGGRFSHCGVDAFQLFRSSTGWKIVHLADTQRRENCWHKP
ncbi:MAG TPA: nuclear transport factor 2 family protein [Gemmatimonadales bacterium]|nr:nuclear transport factor 2 family protein [Gemmatimonadales bacterium]